MIAPKLQIPVIAKVERSSDLEFAPILSPSLDEWNDPLEYISKISKSMSKFGICKIIPPKGWNPEFALDTRVRT
jgi:histone demethylase JARID1